MFFRPQRNDDVLPLDDRAEAGRELAARLMDYAGRDDVVVLGLPRGGVPVAYEVARALHAPLDVFVVRKLGVPGQKELALGALASGGVQVLNDDVVWHLGIAPATIRAIAGREQAEIHRREQLYRGDRPRLEVAGKTVILVDDGIATGATLRAAIKALRTLAPAKIIVAVGVAPRESCAEIAPHVDELIVVLQPEPFWAVGLWFRDFTPTTDQEVRAFLAQASAAAEPAENDKAAADERGDREGE